MIPAIAMDGHSLAMMVGLDAYREVIDKACRALVVQRDDRRLCPEPDNFVRFILTNDGEAKNLLVEIYRAWQIGNLNTTFAQADRHFIDAAKRYFPEPNVVQRPAWTGGALHNETYVRLEGCFK